MLAKPIMLFGIHIYNNRKHYLLNIFVILLRPKKRRALQRKSASFQYALEKLFSRTKRIYHGVFNSLANSLTHWGRVTHIYVSKLTIIGSDNYLNQCCDIVNWTLRNKPQWNLNRNLYIFIQTNASGNVVWEMAAIFDRPQCVKKFTLPIYMHVYPQLTLLILLLV